MRLGVDIFSDISSRRTSSTDDKLVVLQQLKHRPILLRRYERTERSNINSEKRRKLGQRFEGLIHPFGQRFEGLIHPFGQRFEGQIHPFGQRFEGLIHPFVQHFEGQIHPFGQRLNSLKI